MFYTEQIIFSKVQIKVQEVEYSVECSEKKQQT